ncbi:odorant binding protein 11 [Ptiloglossa arizonensis]|uniref:odorant binding protein 11 n=1 Tax=Ptiloglossa arizonensis TaxID=3350558 RepID=UPI003FA02E86
MNTAEFFLIFTGLVAFGFIFVHADNMDDPEEFRKITAKARKICLAETGASLEAIEDSEYGTFPDDRAFKCYFKCVLERFGMIDKKGTLKYNMMRKVVPEVYKTVINSMIDSCLEIEGADNCEIAVNFMKCMYNANPVVYMAP